MRYVNFFIKAAWHFSKPCSSVIGLNAQARLAGILVFALSACGGNQADTVHKPSASNGGNDPNTAASSMSAYSRQGPTKITIRAVSLEKPAQVLFSLTDASDQALTGIQDEAVTITLAKMLPGNSNLPDSWQSYFHAIETPTDAGPGTVPRVQATSDANGTLIETEPGEYRYQFGTDISDIKQPVEVSLEPRRMHRLGIQVDATQLVDGYEKLVPGNATYTWFPVRPDTTITGWRDAVETGSCNGCHQALSAHHGTRLDTRLCVTCHTGDSGDAESGNSLAFRDLIHKLHRGADLPSVTQGGEFALWGDDGNKADFSTVRFPQDIRNCSSCHTTEAQQVRPLSPSREACGSCHDDVDFSTGKGHATGISASNSECLLCHKDNGFAGSVASSHAIPGKVLGRRFALRIISITNTSPGALPSIEFEVLNPENSNQPYDIKSAPAWTQPGISALNIIIGWGAGEFHNTGSGNLPAQPIILDALGDSLSTGNGSFTITSGQPIPANASGSGVIGLMGRAAGDYDLDGGYDDAVPVTGSVEYFAITDSSPQQRRQVVEIDRCNNCHDQLSMHGGTRSNETQLCVICHNPNATDVINRPGNPADTPDGKREEAIDFKTMIHSIHDAEHNKLPSSVTDYIIPPPGPLEPRPDFVIYGHDGEPQHFGELRYPGVMGNCAACHAQESYLLPLAAEVLATTTDTGEDLADPDDDVNTTKTKAACASCHYWQGDHMDTEGLSSSHARYPLVDAGLDIEQCHNCHGPGGMADITLMHPIME